MSYVAKEKGLVAITRPKRGYNVRIKSEHVQRISLTEGRVSNPPAVIFVDEHKGYGCFATDNYLKGQTVCNYRGQLIDCNEKERRQVDDEKNQISNKFIDLPNGRYLDGSRDESGNHLHITANPGAAINNSTTAPNCKIVLGCRESETSVCLMVATTNIPKQAELLWWYGETRRELGDWLFE